jgi:hypothetical protein
LIHNTSKRTPPHEHNPRTRTTHSTNTPPHRPLGRGEQNKPSKRALPSPTMCHDETTTRYKPKRPPELLHHGTVIPEPHTRPSSPQIQRNNNRTLHLGTKENHWSWPLCMGASPHPPPHFPFPRTQISKAAKRVSPPPILHQVTTSQARRLKTSSTRGPSAPPRQHELRAQPAAPVKPPTGRDSNYEASREGTTPRRRRCTSKEGQGLHLRALRVGQQDASP